MSIRLSIFNQFIYFLPASVKFRAFVGLWVGQLYKLKLDETYRKLPELTSSFALCQKKEERSTGPRLVSCQVNRWVSSHPQTCGSPSFFSFCQIPNSSSHRPDSHTSAVEENISFSFLFNV